MGKNIVVCLDGTGNQFKDNGNTNVVRTYRIANLHDPSVQVGYYDPGVGTFSALGAWTPFAQQTTKLLGLALGYGLRQNLGEAYTYIVNTYNEGDKLFIFGFSRGAYTARALAGMLNRIGLFRPGADNLIPYAVKLYTRTNTKDPDDLDRINDFRDSFSRTIAGSMQITVDFMGLWDSVKAAGILRWDPRWADTVALPNVVQARHAVSIDEIRRPFHEYLVQPAHGAVQPNLDEAWFAGVHSDVGGGFHDMTGVAPDRVHTPMLSDIPLKWVLDGAIAHGLVIRPERYAAMCSVGLPNSQAMIHRMGPAWALATYRHRKVPSKARVHASVKDRYPIDVAYEKKIPVDAVWEDADWR